ncbi:lytic transglycosylase domain-containing protein [Escherichia coli]|nr:lytic transglycosylase domain-containing protein [Escherichia coli]EHU9111172.1 lytic transglycosylase domain-containing protein [Escherichia coli]
MEYLSPGMKAAPEQAARGIANIPFDVMDAGVGVVNAAQSAGAWAPGMRSGSRGIAQAEGVLASTPGTVQDAHLVAFNEISSKLNKQLSDFGAESGSASEKSAAIKDRISASLADMKTAENTAWADLRSTMPRDRMKMNNGMAVIQSEKSAGVPLSSEMKQFQAANGQGSGITFEGMKAWRAKFADAEQANIRAGKANAARTAGEMRRAITDDMRAMADKGGFLPEWQKANDLSKGFITAKKNAESVFGRDLASDALVRKGVDTLKASADSGPGAFHRLISSLPDAERQPAIASILQHAASQGEKGGVGEGAGLQYFAKLMTPQNVNAIGRHAPELGRMMKEFGVLAKAGTRPQRYIERTGRTTEALKTLDTGLPKVVSVIMNGIQQSGAIAGGFGGGVLGSIGGLVAGGALRNTVAKIGATRSGRYAIEKAVQEATKAVNAGATPAALAAAEKAFAANKIAMKAIRDAVGVEGFTQLTRAGIVATLSGMKDLGEEE